jgi:hypothetical protein
MKAEDPPTYTVTKGADTPWAEHLTEQEAIREWTRARQQGVPAYIRRDSDSASMDVVRGWDGAPDRLLPTYRYLEDGADEE